MAKRQRRRQNPVPSRADLLLAAKNAHDALRRFTTGLEAYGRDYTVPFNDADFHMLADLFIEMKGDVQFCKRYLGV